MKLVAPQKELKEVLSQLILCCDFESSRKPFSSQIKVEAMQARVILTAMSDTMSMAMTLKAETDLPGTCTVPAKALLDLVKKMDSQKDVKIEMMDTLKIRVRQGKSAYNLPSVDPTTFPKMKYFKAERYIPLEPETLLKALKNTSYAVHQEIGKGALGGVHFDPFGEGLFRVVGCDGNRMSCQRVVGVIREKMTMDMRSVEILTKVLPNAKEIGLLIDDSTAYFCLDSGVFNARLLEKSYPNYAAVIPDGSHILVNVNRADLMSALDRVCLFTNKLGRIKLTVDKGGSLKLELKNHEVDLIEEVPCLEGSNIPDTVELHLSAEYFSEALKTLDDEVLPIRIYGVKKPVVISKGDTTAVIMVMSG